MYDSSQDPIGLEVHVPDFSSCGTHVESDEHQKQSGSTESEHPRHVECDPQELFISRSGME